MLYRSRSQKYELWQDPQYEVRDLSKSNSHAIDLEVTNSQMFSANSQKSYYYSSSAISERKKALIHKSRDILCIQYQAYSEIMMKIRDLWKGIALNRKQFIEMMHQIFPEIATIHYRRFSKEASLLIEGAINSIFSAFDTDGSQRLTIAKLEEGFKVFCEINPVFIEGQFFQN